MISSYCGAHINVLHQTLFERRRVTVWRPTGSSAAAQPPGSSLDAALITNKLTTNDPDTLTDPTSAQTLTLNFKVS